MSSLADGGTRREARNPVSSRMQRGISRTRLRLALRALVGAWKNWREPTLSRKTRHQLAVCAIFREEAPFLDEWITFHAGIGATHFYLYNNFSTDEFRRVLRPWQESGFVTLTEWPVPAGQVRAYADCVKRFQNEARWIAFLDIDEFLFSPRTLDIRTVLSPFADQPGLEVWQYRFGASGHVKRPQAPVVDSYTMRAPASLKTVKTIANPRMVYKAGVHQFKYWTGRALDSSRQIVAKTTAPVFDQLRINHYWSRSLEDLESKIRRGDASLATERDPQWHLAFERGLNDEKDLTIQPIARAIRKN